MLKNIKASTKLYLLVSVLSAFVVIIGFYAIRELKTMSQNTESLYADRIIPIVQLTNIRFAYAINVLYTPQRVKNHEITYAEASQRIQEAEKSIAADWRAYKLTSFTPEEAQQAKTLEILMTNAESEIKKLKVILNHEDGSALDDLINNRTLHSHVNSVIDNLNELIRLQVTIGAEIHSKNTTVYETTSQRFYVLIILCIAFAISLSFYIVRNVKDLIKNLGENEKKYRNIFENVQDVFYQSSLEGIIIEVSPSVKYHLGYTRDELIGTKTADLYYELPDRTPGLMRLKAEGEINDIEMRFKSNKGLLVYISLNARLIRDIDGNPSHIDGVFKNITERKFVQERLKQNETRLKEAQAIAHMGNWDIDMKNGVHTWSDEFYKIYQVSKDEIQPSTEAILSFIHPDDLDFAQKEIRETFGALRDSHAYFRFIRKDGSLRFGYIEWKFELDKDRKPIRLYGILQDITERKRAEFEREKMVNDIIERNKNFEQFSYIVSHNLRAPVATILGVSNILKSNTSDADRIEFQQYLFQAVEQIDEVTNVLNEILKIRNAPSENKDSIYFSELVSDIKSDFQILIEKDEVRIITDFSVNSTISQRGYFRSIFYNLISNSIKFRQPDKPAVINIKSDIYEDKIRIIFKDNGKGLDVEKYGEKLFGLSKHFHLNNEGKGIGLFLVKSQIELLGGMISVKSEKGVGTEFTVLLPNDLSMASKRV